MSKQIITYPNQKVIHINKPEYTGNFLSIGNDEWAAASNQLTYNAFKLYLYLSGNAKGFDLALSPKALKKKVKMSDGTYTNVVKELTVKRYLVNRQGNIFDFYTTPLPQSDEVSQYDGASSSNTLGDNPPSEYNNIHQSSVGEINKKTKKSNLHKDADAIEEKSFTRKEQNEAQNRTLSKRQLEDLTDEEIAELMQHFKKRTMRYPEMYIKYNLEFGLLNSHLIEVLENIQRNRKNDANKRKNEEVAAKFGLSISEANELAEYLTGCTWEQWGEYAEENMNNYLNGKIKTAGELLSFLRKHKLATYEIYSEYIPKSIWDSKGIIYRYYDEYLESHIENPDVTFLFAQDCIDKKKKSCQIAG